MDISRWALHMKPSKARCQDAIAQILTNSRMCAGAPPDLSGYWYRQCVRKWGQVAGWVVRSLQDVVDDGVRAAYTNSENKLRASILADRPTHHLNTRDALCSFRRDGSGQ
jgi:fumarate hydratase class I